MPWGMIPSLIAFRRYVVSGLSGLFGLSSLSSLSGLSCVAG